MMPLIRVQVRKTLTRLPDCMVSRWLFASAKEWGLRARPCVLSTATHQLALVLKPTQELGHWQFTVTLMPGKVTACPMLLPLRCGCI